MQQPGANQFAHQETHAAGGMKVIHVRAAIGIDAAQQRRHLREVGEIVPVQREAGRRRHRNQMQRVVGGSAGGMQPDDAVDEGAFVQHLAERRIVVAERRHGERAFGGGAGERIAQRRVRIDERRPGQMQAHDLHQHLIGVGGAVKSAGPRPVIGLGLRLEQRLAADLALCVGLADF